MSVHTGRPPGRYGRQPSRARTVLLGVLAALAVAAGLVWVVWAGLGAADRDVRWTDVGYRAEDDRVLVTFDVVQDPGSTAVCEVEALSSSYATVGLVRVDVPAQGHSVVRRTVEVPTQERAVSGQVRSCSPR